MGCLPEREPNMASKYRSFERKEYVKPPPNPLWRGIGCILFVVVPLLSYWFMTLALPAVKATGSVPPELLAPMQFPLWMLKVPGLNTLVVYLASIPELWLKLIVFVVILLLLILVSSLLYTMIYSMVGPARYTEREAPEAERGAKRYTR